MVETLTVLIKKTGDKTLLEQKNEHGLTPLEWAAQEGHVGCVLLLMAAKKDAKVPTEDEANAFIDEFQRTHAKPAAKQPTKNEPTVKKLDPVETEAKRKVAVFAHEAEPSAEKVKKALEFKAKGNAHFAKKEWKLAHNCYTEAITEDPRDATFYSNRSACRIQLVQVQEALEDAYIARELRPEWSKAFYRIAMALLQLERFEEAAYAAFDGLQVDEENDELESLLKKCVKKGRQDFQSKQKNGSP
jgi:tetratricopeptide (TPR) repeat protein